MGAIIPALNEERLILRTLSNVPSTVDAIYVIDDGSSDRTADLVLEASCTDSRIQLLQHSSNCGVGAAIITGYKQAFKDGLDAFVVVGGDAQMDWDDIECLLEPLAIGRADYTKGNRFIYGSSSSPGNAWKEMPTLRILGNVTLSILTKIASGYFHLFDSQMGYTAMHRRVFPLVNWKHVRHGYGYPAEWLMHFHTHGVRVEDTPVRAIYLDDKRQSQIKVRKFIFYMMGILIRGGANRLIRECFNGRSKYPQIHLNS